MPQHSRPSRSPRIVIVRPSALGDVCRTVPVLASLRAALPEARLAWVVQDDFADAVAAHPALDEVIAFPRNRFGKWWQSPARASEVRRWFADLRRRAFDIALDCQGLSRSGLITRATRAPRRIGLRSAREFAWLCYNERVPAEGIALPRHAVDRMLAVLAPLAAPPVGDMRLYVPAEAAAWWREQRQSWKGGDVANYAVIAPGSRWLSKRWPIERFADLIDPLLQRGFERIAVIGSPSERQQARPLLDRFAGPADSSPVMDLVGATTIGQTMAIIADAGMVIANDSAPLHMAVGFDRPCIALFGPTDPAAVGPYRRAECVVRAYQPQDDKAVNYKDSRLGDSLMRLISTAMALQAIDRVRALWPQRGRGASSASASVSIRSNGPVEVSAAFPHRLEPKAAS